MPMSVTLKHIDSVARFASYAWRIVVNQHHSE